MKLIDERRRIDRPSHYLGELMATVDKVEMGENLGTYLHKTCLKSEFCCEDSLIR